MNKQVTLTRDNKMIAILLRQMPHDTQAIVGKKLKHGAGKAWMVVKVEEA